MVQAETQGKKERILAAAEEVFSKRGYTQSTLDEIIKIADKGKGTVYKYFGNKENLFYILVHGKHEELMANLWAVAHSKLEIETKIGTFLDVWVKFLVENTVLWQVLMFEMTGGNHGITAFFDKKGEIKITAQWGAQPTSAQKSAIGRYFKMLAQETSPFEYIFLEGKSQGFFKDEVDPIDASRNLMFSVAMITFHWRGVEGKDIKSCSDSIHDLTHHMLHGVVK